MSPVAHPLADLIQRLRETRLETSPTSPPIGRAILAALLAALPTFIAALLKQLGVAETPTTTG